LSWCVAKAIMVTLFLEERIMYRNLFVLVVVVLVSVLVGNAQATMFTDYVGAGHWDGATMNAVGNHMWHPNYAPANTVNGAGLDSTGLLHNNVASQVTYMAYEIGNPHPAMPTGTKAWLEYNFGAEYSINSIWVWNYSLLDSGTSYGGRGFKDVVIKTSLTGASNPADWTTVWTGPFNMETGADNYPHGTEIVFNIPVNATYVLVSALSNWNSGDYYGLGELRFNVVPEPASLILLGFGGVAVLRRKLKK
jgi:hypothetical protein